MKRCNSILLLTAAMSFAATTFADETTWSSGPAARAGKIVIRSAMVADEDEDPAAAGKAAAAKLKKAMGDAALKAVVISECFEDEGNKKKLLDGICSVLPADIVLGGSTYGSFSQQGCTDFDAVCLLGIGGEGISVAAGLVTEMGTSKLVFEKDQALIQRRLQTAGAKLAGRIRRTAQDRVLVVMADAHSPKNQHLVEGVQKMLGKRFLVTGGSANKNAGQTFIYYRGKMYKDSAVGLMLSGNFKASIAGRQAKDNDAVISSAKAAAAEAKAGLGAKPIAAFAFDCAGRRSKLKKMEDELAAMQKVIGRDLPLFGCYCAGEIGPLDTSQKKSGVLCGGGGWHVMFTLIGR